MSLKLGTTDIAGIPTGLLDTVNTKLDASTYNDNPRKDCIYLKTTYINGPSGYRIWSDGYCEQWGQVTVVNNNEPTVSLLKTYLSADYYNIQLTGKTTNYAFIATSPYTVTASSFRVSFAQSTAAASGKCVWKTCGYLASGQY